jgi:hypothetical protein
MGSGLERDVRRYLDDYAPWLLVQYFRPEHVRFTGRAFDTLGGGGSTPAAANRFTPDDAVAVSMLSVQIPGETVLGLLHDSKWTELLSEVGTDLELWTCGPEHVAAESPAARLWRELEASPGIGWVTAHKLCARKRPMLLPVYDSVVKAALQPNRNDFWEPLREELQDEDLVERLRALRDGIGLPDLSLLRVLDVCVWMRDRGIKSFSAAQLPDGLAAIGPGS